MVPPGHGDYVDPKLLSAAAAQPLDRTAGLPTVSIQGISGNTKSTRTSILSHLFLFVWESALIYFFFYQLSMQRRSWRPHSSRSEGIIISRFNRPAGSKT